MRESIVSMDNDDFRFDDFDAFLAEVMAEYWLLDLLPNLQILFQK